MKRGRRYTFDYAVLDPQITAMYERGMTLGAIGKQLGCSGRTVSKRIEALGLKPSTGHKRTYNRHYKPTVDERMTLAALLTTISNVRRKTNASSEQIVTTIMELVSRGKLDIKTVAL